MFVDSAFHIYDDFLGVSYSKVDFGSDSTFAVLVIGLGIFEAGEAEEMKTRKGFSVHLDLQLLQFH